MSRNWDAEQAEIDGEYWEAMNAHDAARVPVAPGVDPSSTPMTTPEELQIYGRAVERLEAAGARREAFLKERATFELY